MSVRVAMIGAGQHAENAIYPSLAETSGCLIAACCDTNRDRAEALARKYHIPAVFTDYRKMLDEIAVDAVCMILPPHLLDVPVVNVLERGLALFIDKPPGVHAEQTLRWANIARTKCCVTMVGFNRRFVPVIVEARRRVERCGPITQVLAEYYKNMGMMTRHPFEPNDMLVSDVIHSLDFLCWAGGRATLVESGMAHYFQSYANSFTARIGFASGACGILSSNYAAGRRIERFELHGRGISALVEPPALARISQDECEQIVRVEDLIDCSGVDKNGVFRRINGFLAEIEHFIACVRDRRETGVGFADCVFTMELMEAIRAGHRQN